MALCFMHIMVIVLNCKILSFAVHTDNVPEISSNAVTPEPLLDGHSEHTETQKSQTTESSVPQAVDTKASTADESVKPDASLVSLHSKPPAGPLLKEVESTASTTTESIGSKKLESIFIFPDPAEDIPMSMPSELPEEPLQKEIENWATTPTKSIGSKKLESIFKFPDATENGIKLNGEAKLIGEEGTVKAEQINVEFKIENETQRNASGDEEDDDMAKETEEKKPETVVGRFKIKQAEGNFSQTTVFP